jgi:hypothetical protein
MRRYQRKVELLSTSGEHLRWLPSAMASALVDAEHASVASLNGKIKSIRLLQCAQNSAQRTGEASVPVYGTRFVVREKLDSGHVIWQFHRRSFDQLE